MHTSSYKRVAILRPGRFTDERGREIEVTAARLASRAASYDPAFHAALIKLGHGDAGAALGRVAGLSFDGRYLYADVEGVPAELADAIAKERYPQRSAELYPDLEGRGPYLRGLALLGARPPAVKGLPGWPQQESQKAEVRSQKEETQRAAAPGLAADFGHRTSDSSPLCPLQPLLVSRTREHHPISLSEVCMPQALKDSPPVEAADDTIRLAEENLRLAEENRGLRAERRHREIALFLGELRDSGQLTPAMEAAGVEEALSAAEEQAAQVVFPDGRKLPLSAVLKEILRALPASFCTARLKDAGADGAAPSLTAEEKQIAAQLGLTEEEYASIKSGQ